MSTSLTPEAWVSVIRKEYLQSFIKDGGASVKFAVPSGDAERQRLVEQLTQDAAADGYQCVALDAATTKAHMIDKVFHAIAKQVDWDNLAYTFLCSTLSENQYRLPESRACFSLQRLATLNELDLGEMRRVVNKRLQDRLFRDYAMTQEFRVAMLRLCQAQLDPQEVGTGIAQAVKDWLCGDLRLISTLKSAFIFQKIGRHNGRHMLFSLSHWLHVTGKTGLVIILDISRFLEPNRPAQPDVRLYYAPPAVLDGYEVLRQLIDGTDELRFCIAVVVAPPEFLIQDQRQRVLRAYDALYFRIWDEVHDRQRPNPLAPLVRLSLECPSHTD